MNTHWGGGRVWCSLRGTSADKNFGSRSLGNQAFKMASRKRKIQDEVEVNENRPKNTPEKKTKKEKWTNKQRVLVFCGRGITHRARHLMLDLRTLLPHHKADTKLDRKDKLFIINEVCEMKNCNSCIYLEMRKRKDLFMWFSFAPHGPSAKFLVENVHTMDELKMTGNCLKGSRPILSFDQHFDKKPETQLLKEMFIQIFSTPNYHPKSKPFIDHIMTFSKLDDDRIWVRNFQIVEEDGTLLEIGPRFVLNLVRIFEGSFGGPTLYENPHYQSPNEHRRLIRREAAHKYLDRVESKQSLEVRREANKDIPRDEEDVDDIFHTITQSDIDKARANSKKTIQK
ncbi:ribosome biogenesis protein BRX1 homolog [Actinia tenebrosa]|uniref:Ribosome biogenesis protein BRX1 homolog n=1 Tax=Actinia tenebrosa TaxID=6105 RepID=A0A6P8IPF3_ACTTE|nr:ribosome biogenesis protein BRX1 homolog [Actinia tenebrosa]